MLERLVGILGSILLFTVFVKAQAGGGRVYGTVTDSSGAVIPHASVGMSGENLKSPVKTQTNSTGFYQCEHLAPGPYHLSIVAPKFEPYEKDISVASGALRIDAHLRVATVETEMTVDSHSSGIELDRNLDGTVLSGKNLDVLPDDPDDLEISLRALAGPGIGPNGNQIYIDGFSQAKMPSKQSIQEVRINENPFSAAYEDFGLGRIELFLKPSSRKWNGSAEMSDSESSWNSRNPFLSFNPYSFRRRYEGMLSGPLGKSTAFSLNVEKHLTRDSALVNAVILDPQTLAPSPFSTAIALPNSSLSVNPRLDWQVTASTTVSFFYDFGQARRDHAGTGRFKLPSVGYLREEQEHDFQLHVTSALNTRLTNEIRFQAYRDHTSKNGDNSIPTINVEDAFVSGGSEVGRARNTDYRYELRDNIVFLLKQHLMQAGLQMRSRAISDIAPDDFGGTFSFKGVSNAPVLDIHGQPVFDPDGQLETAPIKSIEQYRRTLLFEAMGLAPDQMRLLGGGASQFSIAAGSPRADVSGEDVALFVQDDWRVWPNLMLSAGVRYELQSKIHDYTDIAPRFGIAWAPGSSKRDSAKTVIRAGGGIFYSRTSYDSLLNTLRYNGVTQQRYVIHNPSFFPNVPPINDLASAISATTYKLSPDMRAPRIVDTSISIQRQLWSDTILTATYTHSSARYLQLPVPINAPFLGSYSPNNPANGVYPFGEAAGRIFSYESAGLSKQDLFVVRMNTNIRKVFSLFANYAVSGIRSDTDSGLPPSNPYDLRQDYSRSLLERRNRFVLVGIWRAPRGFYLAPFLILQSGAPYNITSGQDLYGDGLSNARPAFALQPGPNVISTAVGDFDLVPTPGERIVTRNLLTGEGLISTNLKVGRVFRFGPLRATPKEVKPYELTFSAVVMNALNHFNPADYEGSLASSLFGRPTAAAAGFDGSRRNVNGTAANNRRIDLQVEFTF